MHEVLSLSLDASQSALTGYCFAAHVPDVLITMPKDACRTADFHKAAALIDLGRDLARQALDQAHFENGELFGDAGLPLRRLDEAQAVEHPVLGRTELVGQAVNLSRTPSRLVSASPDPGEHTEAILKELGYGDGDIAGLRERGVV